MSNDGWILSEDTADRWEKRCGRVFMYVYQNGETRYIPVVKLWQDSDQEDMIQVTMRKADDCKSLAEAKEYAVGLAVKVVNLCSRRTV